MKGPALAGAAVVAALSLSAGCSLLNAPDACSTPAPTPTGVNQLRDGQQSVDAPQSAAVLPTGETLVMFGATVGAAGPTAPRELHSVRLSAANSPLAGCTVRDQREQVLFAVPPADTSGQVARLAQVLPPPSVAGSMFTGLFLATVRSKTLGSSLLAVPLLADGCLLPNTESTTLATSQTRVIVAGDGGPTAVALAPRGTTQRYAVVWTELDPTAKSLAFARLLEVTSGLAEIAPNGSSPEGEAVRLVLPGGPLILGLDAVATGPDEVLVVWGSSRGDFKYTLHSQLFDGALRPKGDVAVLAQDLPYETLPLGAVVAAAFDGTHVLVTTLRRTTGGATRAFARAYLPSGRTAGDELTLGSADATSDGFVSLTALPGGGFLAAWRQQIGDAATSGAVSLRAVALDTYGRKAFTNRACGEADFQLVVAAGNDVGRVALASGPDGRVVAAYTEASAGEESLSQSDVSLIAMRATDLFPSGRLRSTTSASPAVGPPPKRIAGQHASCSHPTAGRPGRACRCDDSCDDGGVCLAEELSGYAGGKCVLACDPRVTPDGCPAGSRCRAYSDGVSGSCDIACDVDADCGVGRRCFAQQHVCLPFCITDADCRTNSCNLYDKLCDSPGYNPNGGRLLAKCEFDTDCRSGFCALAEDPWQPKTCAVECVTDVPSSCPDGGICLGVPAGDRSGWCLPPCKNLSCKHYDAALACFEIKSYDTPVCLPE